MSAPFKHPKVGIIGPLPQDRRPRKTWKHLYDPAEHWERIVDGCPPNVALAAEKILGVTRKEVPTLPRVDRERWFRVLPVLDGHHERLYGRRKFTSCAIRLPPGRQRRSTNAPPCPDATGCPGRDRAGRAWPRPHQAYRSHSWVTHVRMTEDELRRYGKSFFGRKTRMRDDLARQVAEDLAASAGTASRTPGELWLLVALGYRTLRDQTSLGGLLADAQRQLESAPRELVAALPARLGWGAALDALATALKDEDRDDFEAALQSAEELVAVAPVLGAEIPQGTFSTTPPTFSPGRRSASSPSPAPQRCARQSSRTEGPLSSGTRSRRRCSAPCRRGGAAHRRWPSSQTNWFRCPRPGNPGCGRSTRSPLTSERPRRGSLSGS